MNPNEPIGANGSVALKDAALKLQSRDDFVKFVRDLLRQLREMPEQWENGDLTGYLEALAAWTEDMEGYYRNVGRPIPAQPSWGTLAEMLLAARTYE